MSFITAFTKMIPSRPEKNNLRDQMQVIEKKPALGENREYRYESRSWDEYEREKGRDD